MFAHRVIIAILIGGLVAGCATFSQARAERAQAQFSCGLTVSEVEHIVGGPLQPLEVPDPQVTHLFRDGFTDMWLRFEGGSLRSSQVIIVVGFTGTREEPRVDHCRR